MILYVDREQYLDTIPSRCPGLKAERFSHGPDIVKG
jgi:hypothetical protein